MKIKNTRVIKVIFCLALVATTNVVHGQVLFKKLIDFNNKAQGFVEGIVIDSAHIFYSGMTYDTTQKPTSLMLDDDGNVIWKVAFGESTHSNTPIGLIRTSDDNFVIGGTSVKHPVGSIDSSFAYKIDMNGNILWQKKFKSIMQDLVEMPNGNYLFVGRNSNDLEFIQTDPAGNFISIAARKFGGFQDNVRIISSASGGYYLAGYTRSMTGVNIWNDLLIAKLDSSLNVVWAKGYSDTTRTFLSPSIVEASDGSIFVTSQVIDYPTIFGSTMFQDISVVHTDSAGNLIWNKKYNNQRNNDPGIHLTGNGQLVLPAKTYVFSGTSISYYGQSLLVTDTSGNILLQNRYSFLSETWNGDIFPYNNHYLVTSTSAQNGLPTGSDFILAHLDTNGNSSCLDSTESYTITTIPFNIYPIAVTTPVSIFLSMSQLISFPVALNQTDSVPCTATVGFAEPMPENKIVIFPNPVRDELTVSGLNIGNEVQVSDALGKVIYSKIAGDSSLKLSSRFLNSGIYFVRIRNEKSLTGMKFLKIE